jgi:glycolate oxidase FAD binding subunit
MTSELREASAVAQTSDALDALIDAVRRASVDRAALAIRGGSTKAWYGHRVEGAALDLRAHTGIVDYEPSELVITARAGTPLREIESLLASRRQMLAFEPPHFAPMTGAMRPSTDNDAISRAMASAMRGATLGGCIASGLSGPRRMAAGSARDFVLGARLIDGRGQHLAFGGQVMKNVAGYDVSRALAGSLGTLGVITEVSLKVLPLPAQAVTLSFTLDEQAALDKLNEWAGQPIAITASAWRARPSQGQVYTARGGRLMVRLEGSEAAVQAGIRRVGGLDVDPSEAAAYWQGVREQTDAWFASRPSDAPLWRLALPSTTLPLDAVALGFDDQLIEWGGAQRWIATHVDAETIRDAATRLGGHATLWRASEQLKSYSGVFTPLSAPVLAVHRRLKAEFDPHAIFNRGRMYADL